MIDIVKNPPSKQKSESDHPDENVIGQIDTKSKRLNLMKLGRKANQASGSR